jgi:hypothetical protein
MRKKKSCESFLKSGGNITIIASLVVLVVFIAGLLVGGIFAVERAGNGQAFLSPIAGSFADGWNAAKKKLADSGLITVRASLLSGQIAKISGQKIYFSTALINPLDDESLKNRIADINSNTKIILYRFKSADKQASDQKEAQVEMKTLQEQQTVLQGKINQCGLIIEVKKDCQTARESYNNLTRQIMAAQQKMELYEKIDNAAIADLKAGMDITAIAQEIKTADNSNHSPMGNFEDISAQPEFVAGIIQAREENNLITTSAPTPVKQ